MPMRAPRFDFDLAADDLIVPPVAAELLERGVWIFLAAEGEDDDDDDTASDPAIILDIQRNAVHLAQSLDLVAIDAVALLLRVVGFLNMVRADETLFAMCFDGPAGEQLCAAAVQAAATLVYRPYDEAGGPMLFDRALFRAALASREVH
jgi:hypothetical protein